METLLGRLGRSAKDPNGWTIAMTSNDSIHIHTTLVIALRLHNACHAHGITEVDGLPDRLQIGHKTEF